MVSPLPQTTHLPPSPLGPGTPVCPFLPCPAAWVEPWSPFPLFTLQAALTPYGPNPSFFFDGNHPNCPSFPWPWTHTPFPFWVRFFVPTLHFPFLADPLTSRFSPLLFFFLRIPSPFSVLTVGARRLLPGVSLHLGCCCFYYLFSIDVLFSFPFFFFSPKFLRAVMPVPFFPFLIFSRTAPASFPGFLVPPSLVLFFVSGWVPPPFFFFFSSIGRSPVLFQGSRPGSGLAYPCYLAS